MMEDNKIVEWKDDIHETLAIETIIGSGKAIVSALNETEIVDQTAESFMKLKSCGQLNISFYDHKDILHHYDIKYNSGTYVVEKCIQLHELSYEVGHASLCVQKLYDSEVYFGCLKFKKIDNAEFVDYEVNVIRHLCDYLSIAIVNYKKTQKLIEHGNVLHEKQVHMMKKLGKGNYEHHNLLKLSYMDKLTQCYNRRFYEENLEVLSDPDNLPLGVIVADVNSLKVFNDAFGHVVGDELLRIIAKTLRETVGSKGYVSRVGGDEFTIIMPNTTSRILENVVKKTHAKLTKIRSLPIAPSLSTGRALHDKGELRKTINIAENMMYEQKLISSIVVKRSIVSSLKGKLNNYASQDKMGVKRLKDLSSLMGEALGFNSDEKSKLSLLAEIHNIGEVGINRELFKKSARLTLREHDLIKSHVKRGYRIVNASCELNKISEEMLCHHEKWDGSGYPRAISGQEIPVISRAFSIIDAYNAMMSDKPYREELTEREIVNELYTQASKQFDPLMVEVFVSKVLNK